MPRPNQSADKRRELIPIVAAAFAELGYRRSTTAELARRCGVRENVLYRLWPSKRDMFIASIAFVFENAAGLWQGIAGERADESEDRRAGASNGRRKGESTAEKILAFETRHHGEHGRYRVVFAGLNETHDDEIRAALSKMYKDFAAFLERQIREHRRAHNLPDQPAAELAAWALIGLGTVSDVLRELRLVSESTRRRMFEDVGRALLQGTTKNDA
ncbi:MAG: TetR/AcrR family transcriptional regulator [Phycisphaerae bacterium]|nr:TetR/AcrR family transcriptional regulator [Phycisphaerae bacterium]